ncbi:zinc-ribbon domain-containing protein [Bacillus cereus]|uniref:zinc-ribbon domain-containing protein n=1 Tax=Bacillus cereus TaxID=1396 RepID=UPI00192D9104|nr:zinc-ribbon domain-containing protein [Bacillus cereus]
MRDFKSEIKSIHPNITILDEVEKGNQKVKCKCTIDGYEWITRPYDLLKGCGCHMCSGVPRYTTETFKKKMDEVNPLVEILGQYVRAHSKIMWRCKSCLSEYEAKPNQLLNGNGCRKCSLKKQSERQRKTTQQFKDEVFELTGTEYKVIGEYKHTDSDVLMKHLVCGEIFESRPHNFLKGTRCPKCNGGVRKKTTDYYKLELKELIGTEYDFIDEYRGNNKKSRYRHNECKREFMTTPNSFRTQTTRCPHCNLVSKGEQRIKQFLEEQSISFVQQKTFNDLKYRSKLKFDFYIPSLNLCIEYDGKQHFQPVEVFGGVKEFELTQQRDAIKNNYCKENDIHLLRIPYTTRNIEKIVGATLEKVIKGHETSQLQ